jgi:hypothetical protein
LGLLGAIAAKALTKNPEQDCQNRKYAYQQAAIALK